MEVNKVSSCHLKQKHRNTSTDLHKSLEISAVVTNLAYRIRKIDALQLVLVRFVSEDRAEIDRSSYKCVLWEDKCFPQHCTKEQREGCFLQYLCFSERVSRCSPKCKISCSLPLFPFLNMNKIIWGQKKEIAFLYTTDKKQGNAVQNKYL